MKNLSTPLRAAVCVALLLFISSMCVSTATLTGLPTGQNSTSVVTSTGTYSIIQTAVNVFKTSGGSAYNVFSLKKSYLDLGYGYTTTGKQDIMKNSAETVFVAGGGSTWDVMRLSANYSYKLYPEKAELDVWVYENGIMNGMKTQKKFTKASSDGYSYFKSVMSGDTIKSTFVGQLSSGGYAVEVFSFDTVTRAWSAATECRTIQSLSELA